MGNQLSNLGYPAAPHFVPSFGEYMLETTESWGLRSSNAHGRSPPPAVCAAAVAIRAFVVLVNMAFNDKVFSADSFVKKILAEPRIGWLILVDVEEKRPRLGGLQRHH